MRRTRSSGRNGASRRGTLDRARPVAAVRARSPRGDEVVVDRFRSLPVAGESSGNGKDLLTRRPLAVMPRQPFHSDSDMRERHIPLPSPIIIRESPGRGKEGSKPPESRQTPTPLEPPRVDTILNSPDCRDVTVHLELDISDDLDDELEEFSRFTRLGNFRAAQALFEVRLKAHLGNPFIFVQYAEMLLRMGDYKSLRRLDPGSIFESSSGDSKGSGDIDEQALSNLRLEWRFVQAVTLGYTQLEWQPIFDTVAEFSDSPDGENSRSDLRALFHYLDPQSLSSTNINTVLLNIQVSRAPRGPLTPHRTKHARRLKKWSDWKAVYRQLLSQGRVWDFHDVFVTACTCFSVETAFQEFFGTVTDPLETLLADWDTTESDEATLLALLDILAVMAVTSNDSSNRNPLTERCLKTADGIGTRLLQTFPDDVRSRPFLRWVMAKASIATGRGGEAYPGFDHLSEYAGSPFFPVYHGLPFYIPVQRENPGWMLRDFPAKSSEPLEMVLRAARELQDYETEAMCLQELIVRLKDPTPLFGDLCRLQMATQANISGYLSTCISRYLVCNDEASRRQLLADLAEFGWWEDPADPVDGMQAACRDIIQRALARTGVEPPPNSIEAGVRYYKRLPGFVRELIDQYVPTPGPSSNEVSPSRRSDGFRNGDFEKPGNERVQPENTHAGQATVIPEGKKVVINPDVRFIEIDRSSDKEHHDREPSPPSIPTHTTPRNARDSYESYRTVETLTSDYPTPHEYIERVIEREVTFSPHSTSSSSQDGSPAPVWSQLEDLTHAATSSLVDRAAERLKSWDEGLERPQTRPGRRRRPRDDDGYDSLDYDDDDSHSRPRREGNSIGATLGKALGIIAGAGAATLVSKFAERREKERRANAGESTRGRSRGRSSSETRRRSRPRDRRKNADRDHHSSEEKEKEERREKSTETETKRQPEQQASLLAPLPATLPARSASLPSHVVVEEIPSGDEQEPDSNVNNGSAGGNADPESEIEPVGPKSHPPPPTSASEKAVLGSEVPADTAADQGAELN